jgi:fido (protein-threonine AMPylation protein)
MDTDALLRGTPYLIESDEASQKAFARTHELALADRDRAVAENERIRDEASDLLGPYLHATLSDLVAESNVIEGYAWTKTEVQDAVLRHRELLDGPTRGLVESVRSDPRVYEVLGLFKAHEMAAAWKGRTVAPMAHEIRGLHRLIIGDRYIAGRYKTMDNKISGSTHRTADPRDVAPYMLALSDWWSELRGDALLRAAVVHAWLVHIHPFDDGNGRLARVLTNLELARAGYPPLLLRAESDKSEYFDALKESDQGNILPLYRLFARLLRRQLRAMKRPSYVDDLINDRFLSNNGQRFRLWRESLRRFEQSLAENAEAHGMEARIHSRLDLPRYESLADFDESGNGWFMTVGTRGTVAEWLLWFGYRSSEMTELDAGEFPHPSLWVSRRDRSNMAPHAYKPMLTPDQLGAGVPQEIALLPARHDPVCFRRGYTPTSTTYQRGAAALAEALARNESSVR